MEISDIKNAEELGVFLIENLLHELKDAGATHSHSSDKVIRLIGITQAGILLAQKFDFVFDLGSLPYDVIENYGSSVASWMNGE